MRFLKATSTDGETELFNLEKVLTITPKGAQTKILMGAGLHWRVYTDSVQVLDLSANELEAIVQGKESEAE